MTFLRPLTVAMSAVLLAAAALTGVAAPAVADTAPADSTTPTTVSSDPLPTVQVDGVVWSQIVVGNTVYVGGRFSNAYPAGSAPGTNLTPRANILAYDLTSGNLISTFAPSLNAQVRGLAASGDGKTVYAVGDFTTANNANAYRVVALNAATGAVVSGFHATADSAVYSVAVSGSTVFLGGGLSSLNGTARTRAAAVDAATGAVKPWAPSLPDGVVRALAVSPDGSSVVLGGSFSSANGATSPGRGLAKVDSATGTSNEPFAVGQVVQDYGTNSSIYSLSSDGTNVYGTGFVYGTPGNLEGAFNASWSGGTINWIEDCHGDSYSVAKLGGAVYIASHSHFCGDVPGGFPQTGANSSTWHFQRGTAFSATPTGQLGTNPYNGYTNFAGRPAPSLLTWYPDLTTGTVTGQSQAAWSVATAANGYVLYGGEFPKVNGVTQAGLVRFAVRSAAPNKDGPRIGGSGWIPTAVSTASGSVRVSWITNWDRDNANLTYALYRNNGTTPIFTTTASSAGWWNRPYLTYVDSGLTPGSSVTYKVKATDPLGNAAWSGNVTATVGSDQPSAYASTVIGDGAADLWRFGEPSGSGTVYDWAGGAPLTAGTGVTFGTPGAIAGDPNTAATFSGTSSGLAATRQLQPGPNTFSVEAWFKTTSTGGGKIVGFGDAASGTSGFSDRHVYMDTNGNLHFGVNSGSGKVLTSAKAYNDGAWHQVVGTLSPAGMSFYVDGALAGSNASVTSAQNYSGYWRVGGDSGWNGTTWFAGAIDEVAVYPTALSATQVAAHYKAGTTASSNTPPTAAFTSTVSGLTASFDGSGSSDPDGSIASYSWDFGDGSAKGTGAAPQHTYAAAGTYTVQLTVTDSGGATGSVVHSVTVAAAANTPPTAAFTSSVSGLTASFDGSGSRDPDGTIASYSWDFGDGSAAGSGSKPQHTYAAAGSYTVKLTVTDDGGATGSTSQTVTVAAANTPPTAAFSSSVSGLTASFDGSGSTDPDGTIASYSWDFGDTSAAGSGSKPQHTYAAAGTYTVKLTVTDDKGASDTVSHSVTVATGTNQPPQAAFTSSASVLTASFDGSGSSDPDGTIASYAWDFGDGTPAGSGATPQHTYAASGSYTVTLTVTDDGGATGSVSHSVTVRDLAKDTFTRTVSGGLGTADTGGSWTLSGGSANFSVTGSAARLSTPAGTTLTATLGSVSSSSSDVRAAFTLPSLPSGGSAYASVVTRQVGTASYSVRCIVSTAGAVNLELRQGGTLLKSLTVSGLTVTGGDTLVLEGVATGTSATTLKAKVWKQGTTTPSTWTLTGTDSTAALQAAGGVGLVTYTGSAVTTTPYAWLVDDFLGDPAA